MTINSLSRLMSEPMGFNPRMGLLEPLGAGDSFLMALAKAIMLSKSGVTPDGIRMEIFRAIAPHLSMRPKHGRLRIERPDGRSLFEIACMLDGRQATQLALDMGLAAQQMASQSEIVGVPLWISDETPIEWRDPLAPMSSSDMEQSSGSENGGTRKYAFDRLVCESKH